MMLHTCRSTQKLYKHATVLFLYIFLLVKVSNLKPQQYTHFARTFLRKCLNQHSYERK